jgi:hypothetical protein
MLQIVLLAGKFILLIILYLFIYRVIRSSTRELRLSTMVGSGQAPARPHDSRGTEVGRAFYDGSVAGSTAIAGGGSAAGGAVASGATWCLVVVKSPSLRNGEAFLFPPGSSAIVGRAREMDIFLDDTFVSSKHALFTATTGALRVEDLHSTNGTLVNGEKIAGVHELHMGDRVEIGDTIFQVEVR